MTQLPVGTITFLFTDIEGSTQLWERHPLTMRTALSRHDDLLRQAIETHDGHVVKNLGDGVYAVFREACGAVAAAIEIQSALPLMGDSLPQPASGTDMADLLQIRVRIGIHTGEAELRDEDYHGPTVNRAARLMAAGHGGQVLLSATTIAACEGALPPGVTLRDLGEHRLRGLARPERIYQLVGPKLPDDFPHLRTMGEYVVSLPTPATAFVRRGAEVDELIGLLSDPATRLISLVGPGGVGKTRLAIQIASVIGRDGGGRFLDGVYFVSLSALVTPESMVTAVAQALGFRFSPSDEAPRVQLLDFLRRKRVLLVMDSFEHLLVGGGDDLPAGILAAVPDIAILATSRTRLNIPGEHLVAVTGMRTPDAHTIRRWLAMDDGGEDAGTIIGRAVEDYSAMRLFAQCAALVRPGFRLTRDNVADVGRVCRQVQGLPLGIELAAAWLEVLSLPEIVREIERSLDILATEQHGVPERQRSIRAVFDTSWALLSDRDRAMLPMLSVFRGSFTRDAAEFVTAATLRDLLGLVNKSWLQPIEPRMSAPAAAYGRFMLHALLRQYAEEKLAQLPELEERARNGLARFSARFLESNLHRMLGAEQAQAFDAVDEEFDDIYHVWEWWAQRGEFSRLVGQMLLPLYIYTTARLVGTTVAPLLDRTIDLMKQRVDDLSDRQNTAVLVEYAALLIARAAIFMNYSSQEFSLGDVDTAWAVTQSLGVDGPRRLGYWYSIINIIYGHRTDRIPALANLRAFLAASSDQDETTIAFTRQALARLLIRDFASENEMLEARRQLDMALAVFERWGNNDARASACVDQAGISVRLGRYDEALAFLTRAQPAAESIGNWGMVWVVQQTRCEVLLQQGRPDQMFPVFEEMLTMSRRVGNTRLEGWTLGWDSIYALRYHSPERALLKRRGLLGLAQEFGIAYDEAWSVLEIGDIYRVMGDPTAARQWFDMARPLFEKLENEQGIAFYHRGMGDLALAQYEWANAYEHHRVFMDWAEERDVWSQNYAHCGLGRATVGLGRLEEALSHYREALRLALDSGRRDTIAQPIACMAHLAAIAQRREMAAHLAAIVVASPLTWIETRAWVRPLVGDGIDTATPAATVEIVSLATRLLAVDGVSVEEWLAGIVEA